MEVDDDLKILLSEQRHELAAAQAVESDLCFAYQLQMQEAMNASLSQNGGDVPSSSNPTFYPAVSETTTSTAELLAEEISSYERQLLDHQAAEGEMNKIRNDLNRQIHDHAFAREILSIPDVEWEKTGDNVEKPFNEGSASARGAVGNNEESFRVYVKGLTGGEVLGDAQNNAFVGGIGVAIFDVNDGLIFEVSKGVFGGEMSGEVVEVKALIEGLHFATLLGLKRILVVCDTDLLYQCVTGKWRPMQNNIAILVDQVAILQRNFTHCNPSLMAQKDVKYAFKLAQDAIASQATQPVENGSGKKIMTCAICLEDININRMFLMDCCLHQYCFCCMRRHVEVKLLQGMLPKCPDDECKSELKADDCKKFLMPELFDIMIQRIMEGSISQTNKVYCPYRTCSALTCRSDYVFGQMTLVRIVCRKCHRPFCLNCKVPWHEDMTCSVYKQQNPYTCPEDAKLKSLATQSLWRQCGKCNHMVSLGGGCNHIYCRCGHEFCYICGAAWENKKATCTCPLWDEHNIIYNDQRRRGGRGALRF